MEGNKELRKIINRSNPAQTIYLDVPSDPGNIKILKQGDFVLIIQDDLARLYADKHQSIWFEKGKLVDETSDEGTIEQLPVVTSKNAITDKGITDFLSQNHKTIEKELQEITSPNTLRRIRDKAIELNKTMNTIKIIITRIDIVEAEIAEEIKNKIE